MRRFPGRFAASVLAGVLLLLLSAGSAAPSAAAITSENYVIWGAGGVDPGHFYGAHGIAVGPYGDLVYVADTGNNRIEAFTPEGIYLYKWGHFGKGSGDFDRPVAITTDAEGFVYVADNGNGLVQKFTEKGVFVLQWAVPGVIGVATAKGGHVYALSSFLNLVTRRSAAGATEGSWQAFKLSDPDGFLDRAAQSIATDASGNVYVGANETRHWRECHDGWPAPPEHTTHLYKFTPEGARLADVTADSNLGGVKCVSMAATYHDEYLDGVAVNPSDGWVYVGRPVFKETRRIPPSLDYGTGDRLQARALHLRLSRTSIRSPSTAGETTSRFRGSTTSSSSTATQEPLRFRAARGRRSSSRSVTRESKGTEWWSRSGVRLDTARGP